MTKMKKGLAFVSVLGIILGVLTISSESCTKVTETSEPGISQNRAIIIASTSVPSSIIGDSAIVTVLEGNTWIVYFSLRNTITKDELTWVENASTNFTNHGLLPEGTFRLLIFRIDRKEGIILSRSASDSFVIGGPGVFYTEPLKQTSLPPWVAVVAGIGGSFIGALVMWLVLRRRQGCSNFVDTL